MTLEQAVWVDSGRMSGTPCFRGSRLPVQQLLDWLADGVSLDEFIDDFRIGRSAAEVVLHTAGVGLCHHRPQALFGIIRVGAHCRPIARRLWGQTRSLWQPTGAESWLND